MTDTATPTTTTALPPPAFARLLGAMQRRDTVVQLVEECTASLQDVVPALRSGRRVFDGAWVVGLTAGGRSDPARPYTRLDFELRFDDDVTVRCRTTIRQHDLETTSFTAAADDGLTSIRRFVEDSICSFTAAYFTRR